MTTQSTKFLGACITLTLAAALTTPAFGQTASSGSYRALTRRTIMPGRGGDFQAALKEYHAVLKKAGYQRATAAFQSATGPAEYVFVTYHDSLSDLDTVTANDPKLKDVQADLARIVSRLTACTEHTVRIIDQVDPALSLPRSAQPPKMFRVIRNEVRREKLNEYLALMKSDMMPAVKASGAKSYTTARVRYGASSMEFRSSLGVDSWADIANGSSVVKAMGEEKYRSFLAKLAPLLVSSDVNVYRHVPDLSYLPPANSSN